MAYTKTTDFASKDSLLTGDPAKVVKGSEIDAEFDNIEAAIGTTTGTGAVVLATSPTLVTPDIGTPSSGVVTNLTGTANININGTVGATTPASGAFTTLTTTGNVTLGDASGDSVTINAATVSCANGLNFDSNTFVIDSTNNRVGLGTSSPAYALDASVATGTTVVGNGTVAKFVSSTTDGDANIRLGSGSNSTVRFGANGTAAYIYTNGAERVRIDSSGNVGIGTSSPAQKLHVYGNAVDTTAQITKNGTDSILAGVDSEAYLAAGGVIALRTGGFTSAYDKAKLDASGNFLVGVSSATTNGGKIETSNGITFPAAWVGCANANTLDDYEEGTWTPSMKDGSGNAATLTSSTGYYTKIGNLVTASGTLVVQRGALAVTNLNLQGLPFTSKNVTATPALNVGYFTGLNSNVVMLAGYLGANATYAYFQKLSAAGAGMSALTYTDIPTASDATFYFTISYLAAS